MELGEIIVEVKYLQFFINSPLDMLCEGSPLILRFHAVKMLL